VWRIYFRTNKQTSIFSLLKAKVYWESLKARIGQVLVMGYKRTLTGVFVTGEAAGSEEFFYNLREVVESLGSSALDRWAQNQRYEPLFAIARGVAEMAKRKNEAPDICIESEECKNLAERLKAEWEKAQLMINGGEN
jgi:hypothetical protein